MVGSVLIGLQAYFKGGRGVRVNDFIDPLEIDSEDEIEDVRADGKAWASGMVYVPMTRLSAFRGEAEPHQMFARGVHNAFIAAANFLNRRSLDVIEEMKSKGLLLRIFVDVRMNQDQMEIEFPLELVAACCRHRLGIFLISNDISADEYMAARLD